MKGAALRARPLTGARLVLTTHSLEPHRPWKEEQLGTAYRASTWIEKTAYENADVGDTPNVCCYLPSEAGFTLYVTSP